LTPVAPLPASPPVGMMQQSDAEYHTKLAWKIRETLIFPEEPLSELDILWPIRRLKVMDQSIATQLIGVIPTVLWIALIIAAILLFRDTIQARLLPRMTELKAFGVEATFVKEKLERAAEAAPAGSASDRDQVSRRAGRLAALVEDSRLLLINDVPAEMFYAIQILESLRINVDVEMSTAEGLDALARRPYDVVISDMRRGDVADAGIRFINESRSRGIYRPTILTVGIFDPSLGTPAYAYGITNRTDEMINLVFDVLERVRG
jgi:hypothetical protein